MFQILKVNNNPSKNPSFRGEYDWWRSAKTAVTVMINSYIIPVYRCWCLLFHYCRSIISFIIHLQQDFRFDHNQSKWCMFLKYNCSNYDFIHSCHSRQNRFYQCPFFILHLLYYLRMFSLVKLIILQGTY